MSDYKLSQEFTIGGPWLHELSQMMAQFELADQGAKRLKLNLSEIGFNQAWLRQVSTATEKLELMGRAVAAVEGKLGALRIKLTALESLAGYDKRFEGLSNVVARTADAIDKRWNTLLSGTEPHLRIAALRDAFGTLATSATEAAKTIKTEMTGALSATRSEAGTVKREIAGWASELKAFERQYGEVRAQMAKPMLGRGGMLGGGSSGSGGGLIETLAMGSQRNEVFAGQNLEHQFADLLKANGELQRQVNLYRLGRVSEADVTLAKSAAYQSAIQVPDVGVSEQMKLYRELVSATGDKEGSAKILPQVAKNKSVMDALSGRSSSEDMAQLFKFIELRGVAIDEHTHRIDPEKFSAEMEYAAKARIAAMGLVKNGDFLNFVKQAGPMAKGMDGQELFTDFLATMEDMGGSRTGTSLSAIGRQFVGGIMTGDKAKRLNELGLLNKDRFGDGVGWHYNKEGGIKIDDMSKALTGYDVLKKQGFGKFMNEVYRPHLADHGITSKDDQNEELYRSASTDQARRAMGMFISNFEQMGMVVERFNMAMGSTEGYDKIFGNGEDYLTSVKALSESLHTLKTALGNGDQIAPILMNTARGIATLASVMAKMPTVGGVATLGGIGASAGLIGYGALQTVKGFGLPAAAAELMLAAKMQQAAAARQGITPSGVPGVAVGAAGAAAAGGAVGLLSKAGQAFGVALVAALAKDVTRIGAEWVDEKTGTKAGTKAWDFAFKPFGIFGHAYDWWSGGGDGGKPSGAIPHRAGGGFVFGPGGPTTDSIPTMLSNGEFVVNAAAAGRNRDLLEAINAGMDLTSGSGPRVTAAIGRLADPTERATVTLMRLWMVLQRIGETGGSGGGGFGGGIQNASFSPSGGFTGGFGGRGGGLAGGGGAVAGLAGVGGGSASSNPANSAASAAMLDAIAGTEGGRAGYDAVLGNGRYGTPSKPVSTMTLDEAFAFGRQIKARHGSSSALGRYQIVGNTMRAAQAAMGIPGSATFDAAMQDRMARWVARTQGLGAWEGLKGNPAAMARARAAMAQGGARDMPTGAGAVGALADAGGGDVFARLHRLKASGLVSGDECVALAKAAVGVHSSVRDWRKGVNAADGTLKPGTPVATFLNRDGSQSSRYAGGGTGTPGAGLDHAAVFQAYVRDKAGKVIGMSVAEQYRRSGGVREHTYLFGRGRGEHNGSNYHVVLGPDGRPLGGNRNPMGGGAATAENEGGFRSTGWRRVTPPASRPEVTMPNRGQQAQITMPVYLDGRKIAENSTRHNFHAMNGPGIGSNFADKGRLYPRAA